MSDHFAFDTQLTFPCLFDPDPTRAQWDADAPERYGAGVRISDMPDGLRSHLSWLIERAKKSDRDNLFARSNRPIQIFERSGLETKLATTLGEVTWLNHKRDSLFIDIPVSVNVFPQRISSPRQNAAPVMLVMQAVMVDLALIEEAVEEYKVNRKAELFYNRGH